MRQRGCLGGMNKPSSRHLLITGGVRSGKSKYAENQATAMGGQVVYIATAEALDDEMAERIANHRRGRPADWLTVEEPFDIVSALRKYDRKDFAIIIDCLTLYLNNLLMRHENEFMQPEFFHKILREIEGLADVIMKHQANIILVTNEVGWGIVPDNPLARVFRDIAGKANQIMAEICDEVYLMVCGIPVLLKGESHVKKV